MRNSMNLLMVSLFCMALGTVAVDEASAKKADGLLSVSDAVKVVEQKVGSDVLSVDFLPGGKGSSPYYRITVDQTADDEITDVWVNARTGKIAQIIKHPGEAVEGDDTAG